MESGEAPIEWEKAKPQELPVPQANPRYPPIPAAALFVWIPAYAREHAHHSYTYAFSWVVHELHPRDRGDRTRTVRGPHWKYTMFDYLCAPPVHFSRTSCRTLPQRCQQSCSRRPQQNYRSSKTQHGRSNYRSSKTQHGRSNQNECVCSKLTAG